MAAPLSARTERRRRGRRYAPIAEINVTPFVDVMLVLLIVFMISAPLLSAGVPVDLPETDAGALPVSTEPVTITVNVDGQIFVGDDEVSIDLLVPTLLEIAEENLDQRIFVRGDRQSSYGAVMLVMGRINAAGFTQIGLVTAPDEGN